MAISCTVALDPIRRIEDMFPSYWQVNQGKEHTMATNKTYGYARVSAKDQNLARQIDALLGFGIDKRYIFADKASGKDFDRPSYKRLIQRLNKGDILVIKSIDRLGRTYADILDQWRIITKEKGVFVVVLDMPLLDTRTSQQGITGVFLADIVLQLLSYVAQIERENTKQRQAEGIAATKARGVRFGRPALPRPDSYDRVKRAFGAGEITKDHAAAMMKVSVKTFERWIKQDEERLVSIGEGELKHCN